MSCKETPILIASYHVHDMYSDWVAHLCLDLEEGEYVLFNGRTDTDDDPHSEVQFDEHGGDPLYFAPDEGDQVIEDWLARNGWSKNTVADVRKAIGEMETGE